MIREGLAVAYSVKFGAREKFRALSRLAFARAAHAVPFAVLASGVDGGLTQDEEINSPQRIRFNEKYRHIIERRMSAQGLPQKPKLPTPGSSFYLQSMSNLAAV